MRGNTSLFRKGGKIRSTSDRCGKLELQADNESDAILLSLLSRVVFRSGVTEESTSKERLMIFLMNQVMDKDTFKESGKCTTV